LRWAIITGEYPPQIGGVSDYTRLVARGLAEAGDEVHVWTPDHAEPTLADPGVQIHRLPGRFGLRALTMLDTALAQLPRPYRLLVQYVPHAFGWKGLNLPFCLWLAARRRQQAWVMFHEVAFPFRWSRRPKHLLLAGVTHLMAALVLQAAARVFVSIPAWVEMLRRVGLGRRSATWLPIPSTMPTTVAARDVAAVRGRLGAGAGTLVIGHFGSFGALITPLLAAVLPPLLTADHRRLALLIGTGSEQFRKELLRGSPDLSGQLTAVGDLPPAEITAHLAACDLMIQPYADGVSSRRTSMMASLALGLPIVTTTGFLSEPLWRESQAVALTPANAPSALISAAEALLADPGRRAELAACAAALYAERFALGHLLRVLAH
jgi:glycosyltransferase involved in cell wall biosynthesis